jgi:hypothetical protein
MIAGAALLVLGLVVTVLGKWGITLGRLPGDLTIEGKHGSFHFPWVTSLLLSILATLVLHWLSRK